MMKSEDAMREGERTTENPNAKIGRAFEDVTLNSAMTCHSTEERMSGRR